MDRAAVLARFDAEIRADPPPETIVAQTWADGVLRIEGDFNFIGWWRLTEAEAFTAAAREAAHFAGREVQWKVYSHDGPANLAAALAAAGWQEDDPETFLVLDLHV